MFQSWKIVITETKKPASIFVKYSETVWKATQTVQMLERWDAWHLAALSV
jgi:hypothetical protein